VLDLCWNCLTEYKNVAELHRCGRCKWARYCSRGCQTTHWKEFDHKNNCKVPSGDWISWFIEKAILPMNLAGVEFLCTAALLVLACIVTAM
jgi:hypothetical protein